MRRNHAFAVQRGNGGDAQIHFLAAHHQLDAPVLRQPPLGDIQHRHDLDARCHRRLQAARRRLHLVENAVIAIADAQLVFEGIDVNIRSPALDGLRDQLVDEADQRRFAGQVAETLGVILDRGRGTDILDGGVGMTVFRFVETLKRSLDVDRDGNAAFHFQPRRNRDRGGREIVERIGHRVVRQGNGNRPRLAQEFQPEAARQDGRLGIVGGRGEFQRQKRGARFRQGAFADQAELGEHGVETRAAFGRGAAGALKPLGVEQTLFDKIGRQRIHHLVRRSVGERPGFQ